MDKVVSRLVAGILVFATFVLPEALPAREKRGAEVIVTLMGLGLGAGVLAGKDKVFEFEGKSELEIKISLSYLRRQARIHDSR